MAAFILPPVIAFHRRHLNQTAVNPSRTLAGTTPLVHSWPEIMRLAREERESEPGQSSLFSGDET